MGIGDHILNLLFPPICRTCKSALPSSNEPAGICLNCRMKISNVEQPLCETCGIALSPDLFSSGSRTCADCPSTKIHFQKARACFQYQGVAAELIKAFKFNYKTDILPFFLDALSQGFQKDFHEDNIDIIVPVPLHWTRHWRREFNQSELLASGLSEIIEIPCLPEALKRIRRTKSQSRLKRMKRITNLKNAFAVIDTKLVSQKQVLLIDDVYTTGTTVNECSRVLRDAGAEKVFVLTVARALKQKQM